MRPSGMRLPQRLKPSAFLPLQIKAKTELCQFLDRFSGVLGLKTGENRGLLFTDEYMGVICKLFIASRLFE